MSEIWVIPESFTHNEKGIESSFFVPGDSPWFSGHFPSMPILPAIGMLGMVYDTLTAYSAHHGVRLTIQGIKRVRFRQVLKPESHFRVSIAIALQPSDGGLHASFQCMSDGDKVCDGILVVGRENT
ncbi:MAG: hypothetical protein M1491_01975 [Deltaproteobacteria bacterium]|nr:hypothetical protein [Deltaproteobacteria bacterium]MCL5277997.1 hypothetical protein [Deltaproteobacteria bacterium]